MIQIFVLLTSPLILKQIFHIFAVILMWWEW